MRLFRSLTSEGAASPRLTHWIARSVQDATRHRSTVTPSTRSVTRTPIRTPSMSQSTIRARAAGPAMTTPTGECPDAPPVASPRTRHDVMATSCEPGTTWTTVAVEAASHRSSRRSRPALSASGAVAIQVAASPSLSRAAPGDSPARMTRDGSRSCRIRTVRPPGTRRWPPPRPEDRPPRAAGLLCHLFARRQRRPRP